MGEEEIPPPSPPILIHATSYEIHMEPDDDDDNRPNPLPSNEWYILELSSTDGPKLSGSLDDAPLVNYTFSDDFLFTRGTTSALLGSHLYLITPSENFEPGHIYRLDTLNPSRGWIKSVELPFSFENAAVFVDDASSSIYMFPVFSGFFPPNLDDNDGYCYWGYMYDAVEQKGYPIKNPSPCTSGFEWIQFESMRNSIWAFWKEQDLVVAPRFPPYKSVGVYNITDKTWSNWSTQFPPFPISYKFGGGVVPEPYTVINGVVYLLDIECWLLYAYDLRDGSHQVVELRLDGYKNVWRNGIPHLVPLGDSKICFIWYSTSSYNEEDYFYGRRIACATYQISLHPSPLVAILLNNYSLAFGGGRIVNCMPFRNEVLKRNGMDYPCGGRSISSLASSAAVISQKMKYHTSVPRIPSSASFFRASLASGISLLKKCIKK